MDDDTAERQARAARNQLLFRAVNDRLKGLAEAFQFIAEHTTFTCECADKTCVEPMLMSIDEYETLRGHRNRFAVLPGHADPDVEDVVDTTERYVVVEKSGAGARIAEQNDARSRERTT
jgi:uncharacterized protein